MRTNANVSTKNVTGKPELVAKPPGVEGLLVREIGGQRLHAVPPPVVFLLRYTIARLDLQDKSGVPKRLGITAPHSGDGVTFTARSLAAVLAHDREASVCLVDLNWWSPGNGSARPGVAEVVERGLSIADAIVPTQDPRLMYLPAGSLAPNRRPVVARSEELEHLMADLSFRFDHVIVDLPAVLLTSESLPLAGHCEACVLVVRHGSSSVADVREAMDLLDGVHVLGAILNRTSSNVPRGIIRRLPAP